VTFLCCHTTLDNLPRGKKNDYATLKSALLEIGRLSVWDATCSQRRAAVMMRLARDPDLEFFNEQFPWTRVWRRK